MSGRPVSIRRLVTGLLSSAFFMPVSSLILIIVLGAALYTVYLDTAYMIRALKADFNELQMTLARNASQRIADDLRDLAVEMGRLKSLVESEDTRAAARTHLQNTLGNTRYRGVVELGIIGPDGRLVTSVQPPGLPAADPLDVLQSCQQSLPARTQLGPLLIESSPDSLASVYSFMCTELTSGEDSASILFARVDVSRLVGKSLENIRSGQTGYAWSIDEEGTFLFHPDREFIGRNAFLARYERKPYVSFRDINRIMRESMLEGKEGTGSYVSGWHRGQEAEEISKLIAYTPVESAILPDERLWSVAVSAPDAEVAGVVAQIRTRHFWIEVAMVASMLGFALVVVYYQRRISAHLREQVFEQQEYISSIVHHSVDGIIFIDNDNTVKTWNKGAERIFGYTAEEMIGSRFRRLIPPEVDVDEELCRIRKIVYEQGHVTNLQTVRMSKAGRRVTVNLSRSLVHDEHGNPIGSAAIVRDVTDKIEMDKHIYNTEKLASIGILAAGVAHEINNPLAIILGFSDLLKDKFPEDSPERENLDMIEENANHAKAIVENLLGFARITEGTGDTIDVNGALDMVLAIVRNTLMTKKIDLVGHVQPGLPPVTGDTREFQQVIFNLINNATAAMGSAGGKLVVTGEHDGDWVTVGITDSGAGIPDRIKAQIFDPFFTTKEVGKGTGLGLSLCYGIVQKYGGKLEFDSTSAEDHPDKPSGTTFRVLMPVFKDSESSKGADA